MVSTKVSSMPMVACVMGELVEAAACAMGAVPSPASLEKMPRAMPMRMASMMEAPAAPPCAADGEKASRSTMAKMPGT